MPIRTSIKKDEKQLLVGNVLLDTDNIFIIGSEAIFAKEAPHTQGTGDSAFWMYNKAADIVGISPKERPTNEHDWHVLLRKRSISSDFFITNALHDFGEKEEEFGDILFALVNLARWKKIDPEQALLIANNKFIKRFKKMEELAEKPLEEYSFEEYDNLWNKAKEKLKNG